MNVTELKNYAHELRSAADQIDAAVSTVEGLGNLTGISSPTKPNRGSAKRSPSPAGARKSIHHPNENDVKVLDAMLSLKTDTIKAADVLEALNEGSNSFEKPDMQKSIKWLNSSNAITTHGRGRGTSYSLNVSENSLTVVDPASLGGSFRNPDGPEVVEIVRAMFNCLEPMAKVSPSEIVEAAQECFPDQNLERSSFGTIFSQMAKVDELFHEGEGRGRRYWRGPNKLPNAAEIPGNPPTISQKEEAEATG